MPALIGSRRAVLLSPKRQSVTPTAVNIPAGASGVGIFYEDFSSYANNTALFASSQLSFKNGNTTYGALDTGTTYNGHQTYKNKLLTDHSQGGIGTKSPPSWNTNAATYRATIKWMTGHTIPSGGAFDLFYLYPQDTTTKYESGQPMVRLYIADVGSGVLHYKLETELFAHSSSNISPLVTTDLGPVGAELTNGYTIDYFLRVVQTDSTHWQVDAWLAKNVGGVVTSAMRLTSSTIGKTMNTADASLYQGYWLPSGLGTQNTPASEQDNWVCQMEIIDEAAHPDWWGLAGATAYTPLT